jgi:molybdate transport system substrate-binding protein
MGRNHRLSRAVAALAGAAGVSHADAQATSSLIVFAPPAFERSLQEIDSAFTIETGQAVTVKIAPSAQLELMAEQGGQPDVIITTKRRLRQLSRMGLVEARTIETIAATHLILVERNDSRVGLGQIYPGLPLREVLGPEGRLAVPNADRSVAGSRAMAALIKLGGWLAISQRIITVASSRAALNAVVAGEAILAVAYESDSRMDPTIRILGDFPADTNPVVNYCAAAGPGSNPIMEHVFLAFLNGPKGIEILRRGGFRVGRQDRP